MKLRGILIALWLLFLCTVKQLYAQEPYFRQVPIPGTNASLRIHAICQDDSKFIWLATNEGLWKNDGFSFAKIKLPAAINGNSITAIAPLINGGIIAGTAEGKLFEVVEDVVRIKVDKPFEINVQISSICVRDTDEIWFSTLGEGLFMAGRNGVKRFTVEDGLGDNYIYCVLADNSGRIWTGSDGGLSYGTPGKDKFLFKNINTLDGLPDNIIRQLIKGPGNTIGIGMEEKGFCVYDIEANSFRYKKLFENWSYGPVIATVKLENEFWIGTQKSGIVDFEFQADRRMRQFTSPEGFSGRNVNALLRDHEGNIWIGAGSELFLSPGEKIEFKHHINGVPIKTVHTILSDKNENIWFSNDDGVYCYLKNFKSGFRIALPVSGTKSPTVISLYEDKYGFIWMGTFDLGVFRYNPSTGKWKTFTEQHGLVNANVLSIDGADNEIWFATLGGVSKCILTDSLFESSLEFTSFNEQHGLGNNFIYKVFADSKNRIWFATDGNGITCYEDGKFSNYSESKGLKSKIIYSIAEDHKGMIWLSSSGYGVYRFDGTSFRNISVDQGLNDLNVTALVTDRKGNLIIIHKKGIDVLNPDNFYMLSFGNELGIGVIDPDLNVVDADANGNVWIGGTDGIIKLKLDSRVGDQKPVMLLNNVLCFLEKVDTSKTNVFEHNRNHISFDYTTLWFSDPQKVSYQYKLEGYNREWITTRDRFITFPNLRPGDYVFMLRTSVNNSFANSDVLTYGFTIKLPFWQRPWFVILGLALIVIVTYFYMRNRDMKLKSGERLKKEKIESQYEILKNQVNPHFLFNSFNTLITVIEDDKEIAIEYVNKLSDFFRCILTYREKDLIRIAEELDLVETYIFLQQKRYGNNFSVTIDVPGDVKDRCLIPPLALQILIENCLKHNSVSRETKLNVEITVEGDKYLVVKNNINPKFTKEPSTGIGLQNLKNRYQLITSTELVTVETDDYFTVKLPLIKIKKD